MSCCEEHTSLNDKARVEKKKEREQRREQDNRREKAGPWSGVRLERPEWGHPPMSGPGDTECPIILHEAEV